MKNETNSLAHLKSFFSRSFQFQSSLPPKSIPFIIGLLIFISILSFAMGSGYEKKQRRYDLKNVPTITSIVPITTTTSNTSPTPYPWEQSSCGNNVCERCESENECCNYPCVDGACPPPTCMGLCLEDCRNPQQPTTSPVKDQFSLCTTDADCPARNGCISYTCTNGDCRSINMCN